MPVGCTPDRLDVSGKRQISSYNTREDPKMDKRYSYTLSLTLRLDWVVGQRHDPAALHLGKRTGIIVQEAGWAPGPRWTGAENLTVTGIRSRTIQPVASRYTD